MTPHSQHAVQDNAYFDPQTGVLVLGDGGNNGAQCPRTPGGRDAPGLMYSFLEVRVCTHVCVGVCVC